MGPVVTALRQRGPHRVEIELDGALWRVVPLEAVHRADLWVGAELDRDRARALGRELKRQQALGVAVRALRARDHTVASLDARLADRGIAPDQRRAAMETLDRAGLVDDVRFATTRAEALARRGSGDLLIADDLERQGVRPELVADAIAALEPEPQRAAALVRAKGLSSRTLRALAQKGFSEATLEPLVADAADRAIG